MGKCHHLPFELINQMTEQVLAVNIMTKELLQRARIRGIAEELRLVYVKPDANVAVSLRISLDYWNVDFAR